MLTSILCSMAEVSDEKGEEADQFSVLLPFHFWNFVTPIVLLQSAAWLNNIWAVCTDHGMLGALHTNCTQVMRLERFCVF